MKVIQTPIPEVLILQSAVYRDDRGFFLESYNQDTFVSVIGRDVTFVQDNLSHSKRNVLRGLHYQIQHPQAKLVRVVTGEIFDVVVDLRKSSPTFGKWVGQLLSAENMYMTWVPEGFAHGFLVLSDFADVLYKTTDHRAPEAERVLLWNDKAMNIDWPIQKGLVVSPRDKAGDLLQNADLFE